MALGSIVNADYATVESTLRDALSHGSGARLSDRDLKLCLQVVQDAVSRLGTISTTTAAQFVILQAKGTNDASAEIDTADTTIAAVISVPTLVTNAVLDGT